jgi:flagellar hook-length control protein FliK
MKIVNSEAPIDDPNLNSEDVAATDQTDDDSSTFAQLLAKKRTAAGEDHGAKSRTAQQPADRVDAGRGAAQQNEGTPRQPGTVKGAEATRNVEIPRELQALVHEISVSLGGAKHRQVNIELNSSVLKGLHIQIEQQGTGVNIQFISASDSVGAMLTRNMSALAQGLADRGVEVKELQVTTTDGKTRGGRLTKSGSAGSSQGKGGRR